jgi:hypothetical protein
LVFVLSGLWPIRSSALPSFQQSGDLLVMANGNVRVEFNLKAGRTDFFWKDSRKIAGFYSSVILSRQQIKGPDFSHRTWAVASSNQVVVTATAPGLPALRQWFSFQNENSFLTRVEMTGSNLSANWMAPVVVDTPGGVDLGSYQDVRALTTPASILRAEAYLTRPAINDVIRANRPFWPVEANSHGYPPKLFVRQDGTSWCLAVFNYDGKPASLTVDLARAGIAGTCTATDLWSGSSFTVTGAFRVPLNPKQARPFRLVKRS